MQDADEIIARFDLTPHPEGGWYRETFRDENPQGGRALSTAIYFLLKADEESRWHKADAAEIWHWYGGGSLVLSTSPDGLTTRSHRLGGDLAAGERPQLIVPAHHWQSAKPQGHWVLVGCTVAPAFHFDGFEMAPPTWQPGNGPARQGTDFTGMCPEGPSAPASDG